MTASLPSIPEVIVDLESAPDRRWDGLRPFAKQIGEMLEAYVRDLGDTSSFLPMIGEYIRAKVEPDIQAEMQQIADFTGINFEKVALANLYYDAVKLVFGCTAYVREGPDGPIHARNLDWWSPNRMLTERTILVHYHRGGIRRFTVVGWPGFVGALSGVAPGRFAVTLNAVLSDEPTTMAGPISLLLRDTLDHATDYDDAVRRLSTTDVFTDALLLVSGPRAGQMCVIERTPTRFAIREPSEGVVVVTNDYRVLNGAVDGVEADELRRTSCGRFDRASALVQGGTSDDFGVLTDPQVIMAITTQHMRFVAATGEVEVRLPSSASS